MNQSNIIFSKDKESRAFNSICGCRAAALQLVGHGRLALFWGQKRAAIQTKIFLVKFSRKKRIGEYRGMKVSNPVCGLNALYMVVFLIRNYLDWLTVILLFQKYECFFTNFLQKSDFWWIVVASFHIQPTKYLTLAASSKAFSPQAVQAYDKYFLLYPYSGLME